MGSPGDLRAGVVRLLCLTACLALTLRAQAPTPQWQIDAGGKTAFEVASVKPTQVRARPASNVPLLGDAYAPTGGLFSATSTPLMNYLRFAFKDQKLAYQETPDLAAAPGWLRS